MTRQPTRRAHHRTRTSATATTSGSPIEVRLIGHQADVERLVAAMTAAAGQAAGPVSYRPSRYGDGVRAYLVIALPSEDEGGQL